MLSIYDLSIAQLICNARRIRLQDLPRIEHDALVLSKFKQLVEIDLRCGAINANQIHLLAGIHTVKLESSTIKDAHLRHLARAHTIDLAHTRVTDYGIKHLAGVHTIDLSGCHKITDAGIRHLANVHTINLDKCANITDEGLKSLASVHSISLLDCEQITDNGIRHLSGVHDIRLSESEKITKNCLGYLSGANVTFIKKPSQPRQPRQLRQPTLQQYFISPTVPRAAPQSSNAQMAWLQFGMAMNEMLEVSMGWFKCACIFIDQRFCINFV